MGGFFNGSFACDDVEATYRQLKAKDVEFVKPPTKQPWGTYAIFKDWEGNQFVLDRAKVQWFREITLQPVNEAPDVSNVAVP